MAESQARVPAATLIAALKTAPPPRDFRRALTTRPSDGRRVPVTIIAEIKKASPTKGIIRADFSPAALAGAYVAAGADALSVVTDEPFFAGHLDYLKLVRQMVSIPVLRKDFILEPYQIYEARVAGADAVLLIVAALSPEKLAELMGVAENLGMAALVEVHTAGELAVAAAAGAGLIGINNRDLSTFKTDLGVTAGLAPQVPAGAVLVSESGISTIAELQWLRTVGVQSVLVGESMLCEPWVDQALLRLIGKLPPGGTGGVG